MATNEDFALPIDHVRFFRRASWLARLLSALCLALLLGAPALTEAAPQEGQTDQVAGAGNQDIPVAAIYFPSWHADDHYSAWWGQGWNEWRLLEDAEPRFEGHQHLRPAPEWGYFDEADPKMMARQIDLAVEHGIDVFIFDWYWYSGVQFMHRPVEETLPRTPNREKIKYALMWANHPWVNYYPFPYDEPAHWLLHIRHTPEDFARVMRHCIEKHFNQPNYWRVNGGVYFSLFGPEDFIRQLGGPEKTRAVLEAARNQVREAGLGEIHFAAFTGIPQSIKDVEAAGFDSMTSYNVTTMSSGLQLPKEPFEPYERMVERHESYWDNMDAGRLPYAPVVTVGWDVTPRWEKDVPWPPEKNHYPYTPTVIGNTPELFGELVRRSRRHAAASPKPPPFILINAWNEWTEGSALLPNTLYGNGYLEQLEAALAAPLEEAGAATRPASER